MDGSTVLIVSLLVLAFGLVSKRLEESIVTPPMVFVGLGLLIGPQALGILRLDAAAEAVRVFAELTLVLVLFTDASRIDLAVLRRQYHLPLRLLAIGMPLTIGLGTLAALALFPQFSFFEAALLAAILAPTDAALGQAVMSNPSVPVRVRQALNVESGINDGIALPMVLVLAACAEAVAQHDITAWVGITVQELVLGPVVGAAVGYFGSRLVQWASRRGWTNRKFEQLAGLTLAFLAFAGAQSVGGNGFIAAFVAGLSVARTSRSICGCLNDFTEVEGQLLVLITFLLVGALLVWPASVHWSWEVAVYAGLSLSLVRMLPVALSLAGMRLRPLTALFLGWFGPRGLASILFAMIIVERAEIPHREQIVAIVIATALVSIFAHGASASPAARYYGRRLERLRREAETPEHIAVTEFPLRIPRRSP